MDMTLVPAVIIVWSLLTASANGSALQSNNAFCELASLVLLMPGNVARVRL